MISSVPVTIEKKNPSSSQRGASHYFASVFNCDLRLTPVGYSNRQNEQRTRLAEVERFMLSGGVFFYCASNLKGSLLKIRLVFFLEYCNTSEVEVKN